MTFLLLQRWGCCRLGRSQRLLPSTTTLTLTQLIPHKVNGRKSFSSVPLPAAHTLHENETFLTGSSSVYAEEMYERYQQDRESVHASWRHYFDSLEKGVPYDAQAYTKPMAVLSRRATVSEAAAAPSDSLGVAHLIRAYQVNGHLAARLDPLDTFAPETFPYRPTLANGSLGEVNDDVFYPAELTPAYHGFTEADMDRYMNFRGTSSGGNKGYLEELANSPNRVTLRMILNELRKTYTSTVGVEYMVRCVCEYIYIYRSRRCPGRSVVRHSP
jgi:2-oxoglutarate dehydrogenase E1 component